MNAVDTNVLVRLIARDDADQAVVVDRVFEAPTPVFVPTSVVVETAAVLMHVFGFDQVRIARGLATAFGLANVVAEHPDRVAFAIAATEVGVDFIDALHLASAAHTERFVTFDAALIARASRVSAVPPVQVPA